MTRAERASQIWAVLAWAARNRQTPDADRLADPTLDTLRGNA